MNGRRKLLAGALVGMSLGLAGCGTLDRLCEWRLGTKEYQRVQQEAIYEYYQEMEDEARPLR